MCTAFGPFSGPKEAHAYETYGSPAVSISAEFAIHNPLHLVETVPAVAAVGGKKAGNACSCVLWAQAQGMALKGYGAARNYPVSSKTPEAAGFVVTYESGLGHMAAYRLEGEWLVMSEANYVRCTVTHGRRLRVDSPLIKGYI